VRVVTPGTDDVDALADLWVALARDQRRHGSHLRPAPSRTAVRESIASAVVADRVRVVRDPERTPPGRQAAGPAPGSDVVGFVTFDVERGRYTQDVARGVVEDLYVRPAARGEGVGSALLSAAESALAAAGADVVALEAMADNEAARRFYERHGYRPHRVELEKPVGAPESDTHSSPD
jgi:ribosomal protein S18 acetylase RimI-like enzyme